ncbi:MAG: ApaG domain [Longimonas sp.]|uniref:ApaG domain-containing protein n=1 Tax=Longimonas sp. TaxID=2039626 RepID=UPI0033481532
MIVYTATTYGVTARVWPVYLDDPSSFMDMEFAFSYAIHLYNRGHEDLELIRKRFTIKEATGRLQATEGDDLGKRPIIPAGRKHVLDERCTVSSFDAVVEGNYLAQRPNGERVRIALPSFPLHAAAN